jgi:type IV fimbrial biogenesis protein FimT
MAPRAGSGKGGNVNRRATPQQSGFTIIELMIVLLVMAVIMGLAVPSMRSFMLNQRVRNASYDLTSSLILARSEATKRNQDVVITRIGSDWKNGWTITTAGASGDDTIMKHDAISDIAITASTASITYRHTGRLTAGSGTPTFELNVSPAQTGISKRCLTVDLSGKAVNEC